MRDYNKYNNKLNKIKEASKTNYFKTQFEMFIDNLKATWKLIGTMKESPTGYVNSKNYFIKASVTMIRQAFAIS